MDEFSMSTGPDRHGLRKLAGMIPSLADGIREKKTLGKGIKSATQRAKQVCVICVQPFDFIHTSQDVECKRGICESCTANLTDGYVAFICSDRICFVKCEAFADMAGTIQEIEMKTMDALIKKHAGQFMKQMTRNEPPPSENPPDEQPKEVPPEN